MTFEWTGDDETQLQLYHGAFLAGSRIISPNDVVRWVLPKLAAALAELQQVQVDAERLETLQEAANRDALTIPKGCDLRGALDDAKQRQSVIKIKLNDETRPVWETAQAAKAEVASWPAWKRGDATPPTPAPVAGPVEKGGMRVGLGDCFCGKKSGHMGWMNCLPTDVDAAEALRQLRSAAAPAPAAGPTDASVIALNEHGLTVYEWRESIDAMSAYGDAQDQDEAAEAIERVWVLIRAARTLNSQAKPTDASGWAAAVLHTLRGQLQRSICERPSGIKGRCVACKSLDCADASFVLEALPKIAAALNAQAK